MQERHLYWYRYFFPWPRSSPPSFFNSRIATGNHGILIGHMLQNKGALLRVRKVLTHTEVRISNFE